MCFAFLLHVTSRFLASTVSLCCSFQSIVCSEDAAWWLLAHTTTPGWISRSRKKWWTVLYVHHRETVSQKLRRLLKKRWNSSGTNSLLLHKCGGIKKKVKGEIHPPPPFSLVVFSFKRETCPAALPTKPILRFKPIKMWKWALPLISQVSKTVHTSCWELTFTVITFRTNRLACRAFTTVRGLKHPSSSPQH